MTYVQTTHIPTHIHLLYIEFRCAKQHKLWLTVKYLASGTLSSTSQYQLLLAHSVIVSHFLEMSFLWQFPPVMMESDDSFLSTLASDKPSTHFFILFL